MPRKRQAKKSSPLAKVESTTVAPTPFARNEPLIMDPTQGFDNMFGVHETKNKSKTGLTPEEEKNIFPVHMADRFTKRRKCENPPKESDYLEIGFSDLVWFLEHEGNNELKLGRILNCFHKEGPPVNYHVLPKSGLPVSRATLTRMTEHEQNAETNRAMIEKFDSALVDSFNK